MTETNTDLLRFTTMGSVDDGKSTLIGRLLFDSKSIFEDQIEQVKDASKRRGRGDFDLSLLTDGLRAEREQGITIDVAYRYFRTPKRTFIIADTPGHAQYTRNMVTGASTANVAVVLVDARHGLMEQSRRHLFIASLLRLQHVIVCINKMDLVDWSEEQFEKVLGEVEAFTAKTDIAEVTCIPISALEGDNVVDRSENMPWYDGTTLLYHLEHMHVSSDINHEIGRFPVQYVIRDHESDYRGYAGRVAAGVFKAGDTIYIAGTGNKSTIASIDLAGKPIDEALPGQSVSIRLTDEIDISRGGLLTLSSDSTQSGTELKAMLCWMDESPLTVGKMYWLRIGGQDVKVKIAAIDYVVDVHGLDQQKLDSVPMNGIAQITLQTATAVTYDPFRVCQTTGSYILVDTASNRTVGAGMFL